MLGWHTEGRVDSPDGQSLQFLMSGDWAAPLEGVAGAFASRFVEGGGWAEPLRALVASFLFAQVLAWAYEYTYEGLGYSRGFSHTIVLTTISASTLVLAMRHSLLAGLGLFGVLSMIRFRSDLRTPRDLVFVMGSATVGVAAGIGATVVGAMGTVFFSAVCLYLAAGPFGSRMRFDGVLRFQVSAQVQVEPELQRLLRQYCRRQALLSLRELGGGDSREHSYQIKFFRTADREALMFALQDAFEVQDARLLLREASSEF
jgi:hypothetical protein